MLVFSNYAKNYARTIYKSLVQARFTNSCPEMYLMAKMAKIHHVWQISCNKAKGSH